MERTAERKQFLGDIITGSVEAGWPWFLVEQYQWTDTDRDPIRHEIHNTVHVFCGEQIGNDTHAILRELADDEESYKDERLTLDLDAAARGLKALIAFYEQALPSQSGTIAMLKAADRDNDAGDIDADIADTIVQMALLGEIVYG